MNVRTRALLGSLALLSLEGHSRISDFSETHSGIIVGGGTYFHPLPHDNIYDAIPYIAPFDVTLTGTDSLYLIPVKIGFFKDTRFTQTEFYFRYMLATLGTWSATGDTVSGTGKTAFASIGAGANLGFTVWQVKKLRVNIIVNGEYVSQKATLSFTDATAGAESLPMSTTSILIGSGLQSELWLGDQWVLSLITAYQYGLTRTWSVPEVGNLLGRSFSVGALSTPGSLNVPAQFGGLLLEIGLKLNFL